MELYRHVQAIQSDLEAVSALGDDAAAEAARRLSDALASSLQLRLLDFLTEATLTLNDQLPSSHVEVRLAGRDPELVVVCAGMENFELLMDDARVHRGQLLDNCVNVAHLLFRSQTTIRPQSEV